MYYISIFKNTSAFSTLYFTPTAENLDISPQFATTGTYFFSDRIKIPWILIMN